MKMKAAAIVTAALLVMMVTPAFADIIDFTGGTYTQWNGTTGVTDGTFYVESVDFYEEDGYHVEFVGGENNSFESIIGNYYGDDNDVIHGHWATGDYGELTEIRISRVDGDPFDLNYFILTSNTDFGGGAASGNERAFINASEDGSTISYSQLLPPDDWGFAGTNPQIYLGAEFDNVKWFSFTVENAVDCFGMDNFYINEDAPPPVPEPTSILLFSTGLGILGIAALRRRKK